MSAAGAQGGARTEPLRIANCSGFFGDRISAAREMVEGGQIDVLTGDWLAELTMYILHKTRARSGGYAHTFIRQIEEVLPLCLDRGIRVVSNAGGLDPGAAAAAVREVAARQGVTVRVASVAGDDITDRLPALRVGGEQLANLDTEEPLDPAATVVTANAYLGGAPIAAALSAGADVVVTGRVTDASLVVGPGIWAFGWGPDDWDALAGAVVAGHVIECGAQCCGGNYAFFEEIPGMARIGFPLAELAADGSAVITKHPGTGGAVTVGTVTAELLYEIGPPNYLSPDAVARFDTITLEQVGPDRVRVSGTLGLPPPPRLKVTANLAGGWRNAMTSVITGPQVSAKAAVAETAIWAAVLGGRGAFAETAVEMTGDLSGESIAYLRVAVRGDDELVVGRAFSSAVVETTLAGYPGTFATSAPTGAQEVARYWPTSVDVGSVRAEVLLDGEPIMVPDAWSNRSFERQIGEQDEGPATRSDPGGRVAAEREVVEVPLGALVGARSGDKGGNANVGVWADTDAVFEWMLGSFDVELFRRLLPETADLAIERYVLTNLRAINFVVRGILGWGVASNLRLDTQAKGLGEQLRARRVTVPEALIGDGPPAARLRAWNRARLPSVG